MFRGLMLILFVLLLGLQYRLWFGEPNLRQIWQLETMIEQQQLQNEQLSERNKQLEAEVQDLKKGLSALEERARNELGMIREGETFFQLVDPQPQARQR
ncbi:cell division protein FtsB [Marinobacterium arenosum]|uniref:cell division protein FtsB n=1 Tax=Marinobacterium arenosum TaxID=2862496 RepID=UPI001C978D8A|nr:cell division protein FtsB [Marinobacterium arenosum]MBY4675662.1 cell division protein FtsB [Marinobacterium arenosum]